jgi:hypothetical protein
LSLTPSKSLLGPVLVATISLRISDQLAIGSNKGQLGIGARVRENRFDDWLIIDDFPENKESLI